MNIVKLQNDLKGVPDQSLIGYVQNPTGQVPSYLALSELNRRKEMRKQAESSQAQGPQSSVAEQLVSEAQPQMPQGIAGIPVSNVGNEEAYATGGIVAFEDGGDVQSFAGGRGVLSKDAYWLEQDRAEKERELYYANMQDAILGFTGTPSSWQYSLTGGNLGSKYKPVTPEAEAGYQKQLETQADKINRAKYPASMQSVMPPKQNIGGAMYTYPSGPGLASYKGGPEDPRQFSYVQNPAMADPMASPTQNPGGGNNIKAPPAPGGAPGGAPIRQPQGIEQLMFNPMKDRSGEYEMSPEVDARAAMEKYKGLVGVNPFQAKAAEKLTAMEEANELYKTQFPYMALAEAGLAIAAGKSPNALSNIAEGGMKGVSAYKAGQDKLRDVEDKIFNAQAKVAEAQRAEDIAAAKYGVDSEEAAKAARRVDKAKKLEYQSELDYRNQSGIFEAKKANISNAIEIQKMADEKEYRAKALQIQKTQAAKLSDYETFLQLSQKDPANYKEIKDGEKTKTIFDAAKVTQEYLGYRKTDPTKIDEDTIVRGYNKLVADSELLGNTPPSYIDYKKQFVNTPTTDYSGWGNPKAK
jgi:hypothetical protein